MSSQSKSAFSGSSRKTLAFVGLIALGLGAAALIARGQIMPMVPNGGAAAGALTIEQIGQALDPYGKNTTTNNGHTEYSLTVTKGKWNINVIVSLSPNGHVIWMTNSLTAMPDAGKVSANALTNVLKKNTETGPIFFSIANGSLRISDPVPNYDLTAAGVRANVDDLVATVLDTESLWSPEALAGNAPAAAPAGGGAANPLSR